MTQPPERSGALRESKPWDPPQRPDPGGGSKDVSRGGGDENPPTARPNQEQPTDGRDKAAPRGVAAMGDTEAEARTEKGAGDVGRPAAHPTGVDSAAAAGGPVRGDHAGQGGEPNDDRYSPAHFTAAAQAAPVGGPVSASPAPSIRASQRTDGGD